MNHSFYIGREHTDGIKEGGTARDFALYSAVKDKSEYIPITGNRITSVLRIYYFLLSRRRATFILHYPLSGLALSDRHLITKFFRKLLIPILKYASTKNTFIIDVADLPVEQAVDLGIEGEPCYKELEKAVFSLNAFYIFSSFSMREYVLKLYSLERSRTEVCINGGHELSDLSVEKYQQYIDPSKINYVYAGTLNKGRQIEDLIELFSRHPEVQLILLGEGGLWISEQDISPNITYIGALEEKEAHVLVSLCDVGIIPYDAGKFYYNIAYPSKLSFYITAGITFLSTDVTEVERINQQYRFGITEPFMNWDAKLDEISRDDVNLLKQKVLLYRDRFYWKNIFKIDVLTKVGS